MAAGADVRNTLVHGDFEPAPGHLAAVEQANGAGGGVAGIGVKRFALLLTVAVELIENPARHVDLAAQQQLGRRARKAQRQTPNGAHVGGDVIAELAIAPRHRPGEHAVFITQGNRHAVDLEFGHVGEGHARRKTAEPRHPVRQLVFAVGIVERKHRRVVGDLLETVDRPAADPLARAGRCPQYGVLLLKRDQLLEQAVEIAIGDFRPAVDVIQLVVTLDFSGQRLRPGDAFNRRRGSVQRWSAFQSQLTSTLVL